MQGIFYLWLMKDLCPRHNQNSQNHKKTGKNREKQGIFAKNGYFGAIFTQPTIEHARRFSEFLPCPAQKFPTKITGNFSEHIRELSANIREFDSNVQRKIIINLKSAKLTLILNKEDHFDLYFLAHLW